MADQEPAAPTPPTALAKIVVPEVVDFEVIQKDIAPAVDKIITRADATIAKIATGIKDDETMALAVREAEHLRDNGQDLFKKWREEFYVETWYRPGEERREFFDARLKPIAAHIKTLMGHVSDYKTKKDREARLAKERAEAEARRQREEAERRQKEAEEAERRAKQAAENEKLRKAEAEAAEARRVQAEKEAQERRERENREAAARETQRKLKEEEDARVRHAEVAQEEGNGPAKVDTILESATPIAPVLGNASAQGKDQETVRLEQENARKVAEEKARLDREAAAEAERKRKDAEAEAFRKREEADAALAAATTANAAAAAVEVTETDSGTTGTTRYVWDLDSDGTEQGDVDAVLKILAEIVAGRAPISYCGFDVKRPQDFRPSWITKDVTDQKDRFRCPGISAWPQKDERLKRRVVGGRR